MKYSSTLIKGFALIFCAFLGACSSNNPIPEVAEEKTPKLVPKSAIQECAYIENFLELRRCEVDYNNRYYTTKTGFSTIDVVLQPNRSIEKPQFEK
jgi:hypothetical protein